MMLTDFFAFYAPEILKTFKSATRFAQHQITFEITNLCIFVNINGLNAHCICLIKGFADQFIGNQGCLLSIIHWILKIKHVILFPEIL